MPVTRATAVLLIFASLLVTAVGLSVAPADAATASPGQQLLAAAETRTGDWYSYGSAGPATFDCSGLVEWAAHEVGISFHNQCGDVAQNVDPICCVPYLLFDALEHFVSQLGTLFR